MKLVKLMFLAFEASMLFGVFCGVYCTDWNTIEETGNAWMVKLLIMLCAISAVVMQREFDNIDSNEED